MRQLRNDFDIKFARSLYLARTAGLSVNEITFNSNYNTKKVTPQRVSQLINAYTKKLEKGIIDSDGNVQ